MKHSNGKFRPIFDVYGPVTLSKERADYGQMDNTPVKKARDLLNWDEIDLSLYGNYGTALYTSVIFAGVSSAGSGVTKAVWPHQGRVLGQLWSDDRRINNYSCSNEISSHAYAYNHEASALEGIGVFIHEFSHMLGLMDMYDVSKSNKR